MLAFAGVISGQIPSNPSAGNASTEIPVTDERVAQVIKRANDHFSKGKLNLKDNKREQSRDEFDKALDEILMSGLDVRASKRLETFYLEMVEKIYREEVPLIQAASNATAKEIAKTQEPKPTQIGLRQQGFDPSPLDALSKLLLPGSELLQAGSQTSYDRFKDITLVWVPYDDLNVSAHHDLRISAFVTYRGKDLTKPEKMGISFESTPHEYSYIAHSELYVLADGERIPLGRPSARDTKSDFKYVHTVTEWLEYWIPLPLMKKIAHSTTVEMRLDSFEFNLHPGFLLSMEKLISRIPNEQTAPAPRKRRTPGQ
jgi:hypothetical protein